jgi:hypothetical protein
MSADYTALAVAVVGVVGTLCAPALGQRSAARLKTVENQAQLQEKRDERDHEDRRAALAEKRQVYVELNAAARQFRSACHDRLRAARRGMSPLPDAEEARHAFGRVYSRAQMIMSDRTLSVINEANLCLTNGYRLIKDLDATEISDVVLTWFEGPMVDAVMLLRRALREDLGVAEPDSDIEEAVQRLQAARLAMPGAMS